MSQGLRAALVLAVFAAGFTITGVEIALGRLLAPAFGTSLSVWAAIIASVLAALSLGYPLGGILADRHPGPALPLGALLLGGWIAAAAGMASPLWLAHAMEGVGLSGAAFWGRLAAALLIFVPPCVLLAAVAPSALRAVLVRRESAGRVAGGLYALGSLGSVLGILLPALWWIPLLGLRRSFLLLGVASALPALLGALASGRRGRAAATAACVLLLPALPGQVAVEAQSPDARVLYDRDSGVQRVRIIETRGPGWVRRALQLDEGWSVHSWHSEPPGVTGGVWDWMALALLLPRAHDGRLDVAVLGLAGGTVSNLMTRWLRPLVPELAITGVEIDPEVLAVADRYLGLDRSHLTTVAADARVWLRAQPEGRFDLLVLDAYRQPSIPAHLATGEFFAEVRSRLAPGGIAVLNVFAPSGPSRLGDGLAATWSAHFPEAWQITGPSDDGFASRLLLGGPGLPPDFARIAPERVPVPLRESWRWLARTARPLPPLPGSPVWSDDRAPVELWTDRSYRELRPPSPRARVPVPSPARG